MGQSMLPLYVLVAELGELLGGQVHHPEVGGVAAAIVLARPDAGVAGEGQLGAVGRIAGPGAPIGGERPLDAAVDGHLPERGDAGKHAVAAREVKTIFLPSGVQPTTLSSALWKVSWRGLPPAAGIT